MQIIPARHHTAADGTPCSDQFGDVYHSADGGLEQANHVFLAGNRLPERWQQRTRFVIAETGFGLGLNFLATWAAWRADPQRCDRLHFISCELHPFPGEDLARLQARFPTLAPLAGALQSQWPTLSPWLHRLHFDDDRVCLTLWFGDARDGLAAMDPGDGVDAFFLDGFSPARNPDMWSQRVFHLLARLAAEGATLATWSVAGEVREGLRRAGFSVEKAPGFGSKRQMLVGQFDGRSLDMRPAAPDTVSAPLQVALANTAKHAVVIGAGIAGTSVAERLAARGWQVEVIDAGAGPGEGASGNHAGVLRPLPSLDDNRMSRLTRAGTLYGWRHIARLRARGLTIRAEACGVLHLARDDAQEQKMRRVVERLGLPSRHLQFVTREEAGTHCGWPVRHGGWWFPDSGWVQPPSLCAANLAAHPRHIVAHFSRTVARIEHDQGRWQVLDECGAPIASAPVLILAAGVGLTQFPQAHALPVVSARGQVSLLDSIADSAPRTVVCCGGYVSPAVDGLRCAGATFDVDDPEPELRERDHLENLAKLEAMLPGYDIADAASAIAGRVGFRPASPDRLPMIGAVPIAGPLPPDTPLSDVPRLPGLYALSGFGARGLVWSALAGELLAAQLNGEPLPLERDLCEAVDPARFVLRPPRHDRPPDG